MISYPNIAACNDAYCKGSKPDKFADIDLAKKHTVLCLTYIVPLPFEEHKEQISERITRKER
jgi:hypothetical protein